MSATATVGHTSANSSLIATLDAEPTKTPRMAGSAPARAPPTAPEPQEAALRHLSTLPETGQRYPVGHEASSHAGG